ncbi:MAG TPA: hypothetical protein VMS22_19415 [Candidatus Eisenbacteria bacterium]|nr:hypothetical protein [Candidatus Eisenbacteria bacterium]
MASGARMRVILLAGCALLVRGATFAEQPGELDPTFNGGQPVMLDVSHTVPHTTFFVGIAFDDQGRLLVAGNSTDDTGRGAVALVRLTASGAVDPSFGTKGSTVVQMGLGSGTFAPGSRATAIGPRPAGAGWLIGGGATASDARGAALVGAFDPDGMVDVGFGNGGSIRPQPAGVGQTTNAERAAVGPDGATYVASTIDTMTGTDRKLGLSKVLPAGTLDTGFGNVPMQGSYVNGFSETTDTGSYGLGCLVTAAGVLVVGTTLATNGAQEVLVVRFTESGSLDTTFGGGTGYFRAQAGDPAASNRYSQGTTVAEGPEREIYVGGVGTDGDNHPALLLMRLTPGGLLDTTFGMGGIRRIQPGVGSTQSILAQVVVQPDGKVVAYGRTDEGGATRAIVLRLDVDGNLDPSFGTNGLVRLEYGDESFPGGARLTADAGSVVVTGLASSGSSSEGFVAKVLLAPFTTTTTTLPGAECPAAPSLGGVRCRLGILATAIDAAAPAGKLRTRLDATSARAGSQLEAAEGRTGKSLRRKLKKGLANVRRLGRQLASKAAQRNIASDQRGALAVQVQSLVSELATLAAAA